MRLALAQYALSTDVRSNVAKVIELMQAAAQQRAEMIIFPELCLSPFFPQFQGRDASMYAMPIDHEAVKKLRMACRELSLAASPNFFLQEQGRCFDASLMIDAAGEIQGVSKMVHIAQVPDFYEQDYYTPSDTGFRVLDGPLGRVGIVICFDRHYPESVRTCTLRGAQLINIPTANRIDEARDLFECEVRAAAMQNGVFVAMCNRVGREGEATFCGESIVVDPDGNVIYKAGHGEELGVVDLDFAKIESARRKRPYLAIRRPETYE